MNLNNNKKTIQLLILSLFLIVGALFCARNLIFSYLEGYAMNVAQEQFGSQRLAPAQEEKILNIAQEMGITQPFTMRKMNRYVMTIMGYCNAFAYFPALFYIIPLSNKAFLFVSEGFFENLSLEEQRFLIGHELTHIQENHSLYLNFITWLCIILALCLSAYCVSGFLIPFIRRQLAKDYQQLCIALSAFIFIYGSYMGPSLVSLAYRRQIERVADEQSLTKLHCYEGCIALVRRWQKDFSHPSENPYFGIFSDHPSCNERRLLCNNLKTTNKELL